MVRLGEAACADAGRGLLLALLVAAGASNGCTTNHDALARQPKAGSSAGGSAGTAGFGFGGFGNTGNQPQGGRSNPDVEPPGANVLTIVNGIVDAPSVRICFARVGENGETEAFVGSPLPELGYAASTVLLEVDGLSLIDDVIQPWVIAGQLSLLKKLSCEDAVALAQAEEAKVTPIPEEPVEAGQGGEGGVGHGGAAAVPGSAAEAGAGGAGEPLEFPALRARALAALPAGTVNIGRSILMVLSGCIGGAAYTDHIETAVCGNDYTPQTPTLQPIVVKLSRQLSFDKVGLQAVHASAATASLDIRASGDSGAVSLVFATDVTFGAIEPRPAALRFSPAELGVDQLNYGLQAIDEAGGVAYQEAWSDILAVSALPTPVAGRTYTAVFLGPDPLLIKEGWWNTSAFSLVDNDPTRD
ncbi:MAG TPA: hypothetical protein VHP33_08860 [Polyangiaceae bacterium]|nr:hypothetical protein [Polyangiaceae bacterium]